MKPFSRRLSALGPLRPWLRLIADRRGRLWLGGGLMLATLLSALGLLTLSGWFITATAVAAMGAFYLDVFTPGSGIRLFAVSRTVSRYLERLYNHDTVLRLLADLRTRVFARLLALDVSALAGARASQWLQRLTADIDTLDNLYLRLLAPPLMALVALLGFVGFVGYFLPIAAWTLLAVLLPLWLALTLGCGWWGWKHSRDRVDRQERLRVRSIEQLEGLAELTAFGALTRHRAQWVREEAALLDDQRRLGRRAASANALSTLGVQLAALGVLLLGLAAFRSAEISAAVAVMLALGTLAMSEALAALPAAFTQLGATVRAAERLNRLTSPGEITPNAAEGASPRAPTPAPDTAADAGEAAGAAPSLIFQDVTLTRGGRVILDAFSLTIAAGERVAIIGASGSGKSTLAQLTATLVMPTSGTLRIDGKAWHDTSPASWPARIGYLTQRADLFHDTLAANLRLGDPTASDERLWQVLEAVALGEWAESLTAGLETWVGEQGRQLSGGQARRVALARVMLRDSPMVILDEPLSGLDANTATRLRKTLDDWLGQRTALLLAHDLDALPRCDRHVTL